MNELLRIALLKEHARDKRLTFFNHLWTWILISGIYYFIFIYSNNPVFDSNNMEFQQPVLKYIIIGGFLMWIAYGLSEIMKVSRRKAKIKHLTEQLYLGARATKITEHREYKIKIPLFKINFNLCPVEYLGFTLDTEPTKFYFLPVPYAYIPELKTALSGVSNNLVNKYLNEIYSDKEIVHHPTDDTEPKTIREFQEFLSSELMSEVETLEKNRKFSLPSGLISTILMLIVMGGVFGFTYYNTLSGGMEIDPTKVLTVFGIGFAVYYAVLLLIIQPIQKKKYNEKNGTQSTDFRFKTGIMEQMVKFISPKAKYIMHGHIGVAELMASGLFKEANYDIKGNDLIIGRHRGIPFQFCDLAIDVNDTFTYENEEPDVAFYGQYFVARFNKSFSGSVYLIPRKGLSRITDNAISSYIHYEGEKVELEDPEFMKMFKVYATDQIEARYILSTSLMEHLKTLVKRTKGDYYVSFYRNKITVANNSGKNNFEIKPGKSLVEDNCKVLTDFYTELSDQFALIDDLKLNIKIWK